MAVPSAGELARFACRRDAATNYHRVGDGAEIPRFFTEYNRKFSNRVLGSLRTRRCRHGFNLSSLRHNASRCVVPPL